MFIPEEDYSKIQHVLPILCVDCLIVHDERCLLMRRTREPAKGQYWFPGGRVFKGDTLRDTALRKAREEVSIDCQFEGFISIEETIFKRTHEMISDIHTVNICCHLIPLGLDSLKMDESHDHYIWVGKGQTNIFNLHPAVAVPMCKYFSQPSSKIFIN